MSDKPVPSKDNIVEFLSDIFQRRGREEYLGECVTMEQHMLQAAHFAKQANESEEVIIAALLHDIGHFTSEFGAYSPDDTEDKHHEDAGAEILQTFFPKLISDCARYHVAAKRYLCATTPDYFNKLSPASVHTLSLQGGPMNDVEIAQFESNPYLTQIVNVRRYDEAGKEPDLETEPFSYYLPMMRRLVAAPFLQGGD